MAEKTRKLEDLYSECVIKFAEPPGFTAGRQMVLAEEVLKSIRDLLRMTALGTLANDGLDCMVMGDNEPVWKNAKVKLTVEIVTDDPDDELQGQGIESYVFEADKLDTP